MYLFITHSYSFLFPAVGDLASFSEQTSHYHAEYGYTTSLFHPATRPRCVTTSYNNCSITPVPALRHCNLYRTDGKTGSKLFTLSPVVLEDQYVDDPEMEMPPRKVCRSCYVGPVSCVQNVVMLMKDTRGGRDY